jgi:hypothetical protein
VARSGAEPRVADLDVYRRGSRAVRQIKSGMQAELARKLVAHPDSPARDSLPVRGGQRAFEMRASDTRKRNDTPTAGALPASLELE